MDAVSTQDVSQRLAFYRGLLSLVGTRQTEEELIRAVVDMAQAHFPDYRATFAWISESDQARIVYSAQPASMPPLTGKNFDLSLLGPHAKHLRRGEPLILRDVRTIPGLEKFAAELAKMGGNISRLDVPFFDLEGSFGVLSLTSPTPVAWNEGSVAILKEVGDLAGLMIREARARARLERSEMLFRQFAENVQVVFWMTDVPKFEMLYVSPAYEKIWGRSVESLFREPMSFLNGIHPEDRERVRAAVARQSEDSYEETYRLVRPDGTVRWIKDRGFHVRDEKGEVYRVVGIAEDITALREAQDRLQTSQAQMASNAKFAALGEMASGIAHEINNPLAVIHGLTVQMQELFRNGSASTQMVLDSLASMEKMANRIAAIVKGLRTFSRQTEGDPMAPADLGGIVQETLAMCEAKLRAADIRVSLKLPPEKVSVKCRSSEISQVLLNLVSNAYDAVGSVRDRSIELEVGRREGRAWVSVEDTGPGIEPARRERIFQPFYTTKEVGRGTGLGLSISKGIVEAHGGTLILDTSSRKTRFVIELPTK
jgi:PAS domain S-box-containing protein